MAFIEEKLAELLSNASDTLDSVNNAVDKANEMRDISFKLQRKLEYDQSPQKIVDDTKADMLNDRARKWYHITNKICLLLVIFTIILCVTDNDLLLIIFGL